MLLPVLLLTLAAVACSKEKAGSASVTAPRPSILLVTLDTTRADAIGPEAPGAETPAFNALAARSLRFRYAYATAPQTLPSHASMLTGLYPGGHGVHENARYLSPSHPLVAERLREAGYRTAAFVSAYPLARAFGLARGFEVYDDELADGRAERSATETADRVIGWLRGAGSDPIFLWVHFFDPHYPYEPPEPFRARFEGNPYRGEIAAMDAQLGRVVAEFERLARGPVAILVAGDHGESLGEHGEAQHGKLLYQGVMRVPLLIAGPGVDPAVSDAPVSIRRIFHTILDWAGVDRSGSLRESSAEVVMGEAMEPFLQYGWQPQVMAVDGNRKAIHAGAIEIYDVGADPGESRDLAASGELSRAAREAIREYPIPSPSASSKETLTDEDRRRLASLGYVSSESRPVIRKDAPRPRDMVHLFEDLDRASGLFVREEYRTAIPLLERILAEDPYNVSTALRLATAHSMLGHDEPALAALKKAESIAPSSPDVRAYRALHYARSGDWTRAIPLLEAVLAESPDRVPALEALAEGRERQGRLEDAFHLREKLLSLKTPSPAELIRAGELAMRLGRTDPALRAFEKARSLQGPEFRHDLELGVLYLAARRLHEARAALDRVGPSHPGYPMALFKRAQVSVLLGEPDRNERIALARKHADPATRELIARERLFQ
jgi:choline-sulfatase